MITELTRAEHVASIQRERQADIDTLLIEREQLACPITRRKRIAEIDARLAELGAS